MLSSVDSTSTSSNILLPLPYESKNSFLLWTSLNFATTKKLLRTLCLRYEYDTQKYTKTQSTQELKLPCLYLKKKKKASIQKIDWFI